MSLSPLVLKKVFNAPRERVFDAWSKPELMQQWFSPDEANWQRKSQNVLKVGGQYKHDMIAPDGQLYSHTGEYKEITPPSKLAFTWNSHKVSNTLVTIELKAIDKDHTELTLIHEYFVDEEIKNQHQDGWTRCLAHLEKYLAAPVEA